MSWFYKPYVPVAQRRADAARLARKMLTEGKKLCPVEINTRDIATTFWGKAWNDNLESYSDYSNRMPRGRTYVKNGSVLHLAIEEGKIEGLVMGSELYKIKVSIAHFPQALWTAFKATAVGRITNLLDLIQGKLPKDVLSNITKRGKGLFPDPKEIEMSCSCPDSAGMCKHLAALLYGVGHRLDSEPGLFFTLRSLNMQELIAAVGDTAQVTAGASDGGLETSDLSDIFGIDIDVDRPVPTPQKKVTPKVTKKITKKAAKKALLPPPLKTAKKATKNLVAKVAQKTVPQKTARPKRLVGTKAPVASLKSGPTTGKKLRK